MLFTVGSACSLGCIRSLLGNSRRNDAAANQRSMLTLRHNMAAWPVPVPLCHMGRGNSLASRVPGLSSPPFSEWLFRESSEASGSTNNTLAGTQTSTEEPITLSREDGKVAVEIGTATQTDLSAEMVGQMSGELNRLTEENRTLRSSLQAGLLNEETFAGDDKRVHFYTGLPSFAALILLFSVVSDHINYTALSSLTKFQQLVLILMKSFAPECPSAGPGIQIQCICVHCIQSVFGFDRCPARTLRFSCDMARKGRPQEKHANGVQETFWPPSGRHCGLLWDFCWQTNQFGGKV